MAEKAKFRYEDWTEWIASPEGKKAAEGTTTGIYLENRLWAAFVAGRELSKPGPRPRARRRKGK
jgi:hypothetical protein